MDFSFTDDQLHLRDAVRDLLAKECTSDVVRAAWGDGPGYDASLWGHLAEMGVFGILVPEELGGLGMTELELALVMEELGRVAAPGPLVEHAAVAVPLVADTAASGVDVVIGGKGSEEWIPKSVAGEALLTFGEFGDAGVGWADRADLILVAGEYGGTEVYESSDVRSFGTRRLVDGAMRYSVPVFGEGARGMTLTGESATSIARDRGAIAAAAQMVGLGARMIEMAADYVKERHQFGVPVGSYQAVKHHLANAHVAVEHARPVVHRAAYAMAHREEAMSRDVSFAKVYAARAADAAGRAALQCHGAIGYSFEHDLHMWMKRAWVLRVAWGTTSFHLDRVAAAVVD